MKKVFMLLLSLAFIHFSYSQMHFGLMAGGILPKQQRGSYTAWYAGGFSQIRLTSGVLLQPELEYSPRVYDYYSYSPMRVNYKLHYLTMPILLNYSPVKHLELLLGPELSYLFQASRRVQSDPITKYNATDYLKKMAFGANTGMGYAISHRVGITFRYYYEFKNLKEYSIMNSLVSTHSQLRVGLHYRL